jgi:hypothetical protein
MKKRTLLWLCVVAFVAGLVWVLTEHPSGEGVVLMLGLPVVLAVLSLLLGL